MKKFFFLIFMSANILLAEAKEKTSLANTLLETQYLKKIDDQILNSILDTSIATINWVIIYTSHCEGTKYILKTADSLKTIYNSKLKVILCSSENTNNIKEIENVLANYRIEPITYIIDDSKFKEKKNDDRYKGLLFRDKICPACHIDLIGVPYSILFSSKSKIIFSGFPSKNDIPFLIKSILE